MVGREGADVVELVVGAEALIVLVSTAVAAGEAMGVVTKEVAPKAVVAGVGVATVVVALVGAGAGERGVAVAVVVVGLPVGAEVAERRRFRPSSIRP